MTRDADNYDTEQIPFLGTLIAARRSSSRFLVSGYWHLKEESTPYIPNEGKRGVAGTGNGLYRSVSDFTHKCY